MEGTAVLPETGDGADTTGMAAGAVSGVSNDRNRPASEADHLVTLPAEGPQDAFIARDDVSGSVDDEHRQVQHIEGLQELRAVSLNHGFHEL